MLTTECGVPGTRVLFADLSFASRVCLPLWVAVDTANPGRCISSLLLPLTNQFRVVGPAMAGRLGVPPLPPVHHQDREMGS